MTRITTNVLRDISLFHAETAEDAEIPFAMDKCTANLCVTLRPLREKNLFLCTSVKILCKSVISVCPQKNMSLCSSVKNKILCHSVCKYLRHKNIRTNSSASLCAFAYDKNMSFCSSVKNKFLCHSVISVCQ